MRPIDAEALLTVPNVQKVTEYDETGEGITYLAVPVEAIEKAHTLEAVPVVRCKDCKYFKWGDYCTHEKMEHSKCRENDFCSYGEKRNPEDEDDDEEEE